MGLSAELISQFAKITNDRQQHKTESILYGKIPYPGANGNWWIDPEDPTTDTNVPVTESIDATKEIYVHLDGARNGNIPSLVRVRTTSAVQHGDRVIVSIRNHMAVVTGNLTTPSTTVEHVTEVETTITTKLETDYVTTDKLTVVQSTIGQLADSISMLVTDGNGTSLMTQTEDGWTFSTSDIQAAVDRTSEALADLVAQCGNTDAAVEVLQQSVSDLGIMAEYIRIGTHEGEPCIELGEGDSNFKLLITNTRIMFMDGSDIPAYISNKALHIKKAVIEEELHQGGYAWVTRSNGHLSLIWKGATN